MFTGGSSGIGAGLAVAFHRRGAPVIYCRLDAGQSLARLASIVARFSGLRIVVVDVADAGRVAVSMADRGITTPINNANVQTAFHCTGPKPPNAAAPARTVDVGPERQIQVTDVFLPVLRRQPRARLAHVGSKRATCRSRR